MLNPENTYEIIFYSEGYNFLKIISGMGGLAFAAWIKKFKKYKYKVRRQKIYLY